MHVIMSGMSGNKGGKETYIVGMTRELVKLGDTVDFLTVDEPMAYEHEMESLGCKIYHVTKRSEHPVGHRRAISHVLRSSQFDVVWSHKTTLSSIDDLEVAKGAGVPTRIIHSHCTENMGGKFTALMHAVNRRRIHGIATSFYACSQRAGEYFFPDRIEFQVVKNAFYVDEYLFNATARKAVRNNLGIQEDTFALCHVGRFSPEKNHLKIVSVFEKIHAKHNNSVLLLCGDGPTKQTTENLAVELGIADNVLFLGAVDNVSSILSSSDAFIFPSLHEGLPYALLEAQANGLPCIISDSIDCDGFRKKYISCLNNDYSDDIWAEECCRLAHMRSVNPDESFNKQYDLTEEALRMHEQLQFLQKKDS